MNTRYTNFNLFLTESQVEKIVKARQKNKDTTIQISAENLHNETSQHPIPLTKLQIKNILEAKNENHGINLKLSAAQLKYLEKTGGLLPLLALLPLIFGGLGAAGGIAGGVASAVSSAKNAAAALAAQAELERHNRAVEEQLKTTGSGIISDKIENIPVLGKLAPYLRKIGLGVKDSKRVMNGENVCTQKGLQVKQMGAGIYLEPITGSGVFLGPAPR